MAWAQTDMRFEGLSSGNGTHHTVLYNPGSCLQHLIQTVHFDTEGQTRILCTPMQRKHYQL